jgi:ADP-ribosylglycohydrolase
VKKKVFRRKRRDYQRYKVTRRNKENQVCKRNYENYLSEETLALIYVPGMGEYLKQLDKQLDKEIEEEKKYFLNKIKGVLFGIGIGDALGVPVEFIKRDALQGKPVNDFIGYGTHNKPPGTFSDDGSMTYCLAEALTYNFNLGFIAGNMLNWADNNYWAAGGRSFGFGKTTLNAIFNLQNGIKPELAGGKSEKDNGNGSLMRISPLIFYVYNKPLSKRFDTVKKVSSITHGHIRSIIACFYYIEFMVQILDGNTLFEAYHNLQVTIPYFLNSITIEKSEFTHFDRLLKKNIFEVPESEIKSGGYVIETLEASIWCLLTTKNYKDAVLKAVNLGGDSDTTGCVTGGLAGFYYGYDNIPEEWINKLAKYNEIDNLSERLLKKIQITKFVKNVAMSRILNYDEIDQLVNPNDIKPLEVNQNKMYHYKMYHYNTNGKYSSTLLSKEEIDKMLSYDDVDNFLNKK